MTSRFTETGIVRNTEIGKSEMREKEWRGRNLEYWIYDLWEMKNYEIEGTKMSNYEFPCDDLEEVPIEKSQGHIAATRNITFDDWRKANWTTMEIWSEI